MKAMVLDALGDLETQHTPLEMFASSDPIFATGEALIKVTRCGVWHAELERSKGGPPIRLHDGQCLGSATRETVSLGLGSQ
jgi:D-arabinose 1-dehydrogenase-like Zn-dependent alcohol dehydrogenase